VILQPVVRFFLRVDFVPRRLFTAFPDFRGPSTTRGSQISRNELSSSIPRFPMDHQMASEQTTNWPDLAIGLYDRLTGRNAEITYEFSDMCVKVPSGTGPQAEHAEWRLNGVMKIRTEGKDTRPN
jgi:hypothetical protein